MRWMMICMLVSLGTLLLAAAGMARHVWVERKLTQRKSRLRAETPPVPVQEIKPESTDE